jgi:hypothetical protein
MSTPVGVDMDTVRQAVEQRNVDMLVSLYADDAQMQIIDRVHQPSSPLEIRGRQAIATFLTDIYNRDMTHRVMDEVVGRERLSFNETCQYPGGERVLAASVCDIQNGKIVRQVTVLAWDETKS